MLKTLLTCCLVLWLIGGSAQPDYGCTVGIAFSFGTASNRLGVSASAYAGNGQVQANATLKAYYNFQSLGYGHKTPELQFGLGGQFGYGRRDSLNNSFIGIVENNTVHRCGAGAAVLWYADRLGTSQFTGIASANFGRVTLITENDLFANWRSQTDRFRTGAFAVEYRHFTTKIGVNATLWTADYGNATVIDDPTDEWCKFGYYQDDDKSPKKSLGLLSVQFRQVLPYRQQAVVNAGVNSEKVRNAIQNEFIHDQPFMPEKWIRRKPPHIPMYCSDGSQFLYREGQAVKPTQFYFNLGLNTLPFY